MRDYVCFVQRNVRQPLIPLLPLGVGEPDPADQDIETEPLCIGRGEAVLVRVPERHPMREILGWDLTAFQRFPIIRSGYDWEQGEFAEAAGYATVAPSRPRWWERAIWTSPDYPDDQLVVFDPEAYRAFVSRGLPPGLIPWEYYREVFQNQGWLIPETKSLAWWHLVHSGEKTLWSYDGMSLAPLAIPDDFVRLRQRVLALPVFTESYTYRPERADRGELRGVVLTRGDVSNVGAAGLAVRRADVKDEEVTVRFRPAPSADIPHRLRAGCLVCGKQRDLGSYFCLQHAECDADGYREQVEIDIRRKAEKLMGVLRSLLTARPPPVIAVRGRHRANVFLDLVV